MRVRRRGPAFSRR